MFRGSKSEDPTMSGHQVVICLVGIGKLLPTQPAEVCLALCARHMVATMVLLNCSPAAGAGSSVGSFPTIKLLITMSCRRLPGLISACMPKPELHSVSV